MKKVTFTLDGEQVQVDAGTTILSAAKSKGIFIPTFCHNKDLKPFASCFVCVVEVAGRKNLLPSCSTAATEGMVINTETERVKKARKTCVELLLSDHEGDCVGPCMSECPAGIDIPGFVKHLAQGNDRAALELIKHNMPLPGILGRVCTRPCEDGCRRQLVEKEIAICHLKRFAADQVAKSGDEYIAQKASSTGKTVAIVGAGPAGLTAAYYLQILGHQCTIFEMQEKAGGMTRYGIPSYRLPRDIIEGEVAVIEKLGATIKYNTKMGKDITLEQMRSDFDAVFLGLGAQLAKAMRVKGENSDGVLTGIGFLGTVSRDESYKIGNKVMVVGGGNTAVDVARTALRLGSKEVSILYRRTRKEMPALDIEVDAADEEGVVMDMLAAPVNIENKDGKLHVTCIKMVLGEPDDSGRRRPVPQKNSEHVRIVDNVVSAIGQDVDPSDCLGINLTRWDSIDADIHKTVTNMNDVFAGGDCVTGADIAVTAVAAGRRGAISIDQYIMGHAVTGDPKVYNHTMGSIDKVDKKVVLGFEKIEGIHMPELKPAARAKTFEEVETGFVEAEVRKEAQRCMECGCRDAHKCKLRNYATSFEAVQDCYVGIKRVFDRDDTSDEFIYEKHKCIQCGICVRLTQQILKTSSMGFTGRGITSRIEPSMGRKLKDVNLQDFKILIENCPVGALTLKEAKVATLDSQFTRPISISK